MAPPSKKTGSAKDTGKSSGASSKLITLKVSSDRLRTLLEPILQTSEEDTPMKDANDSPSADSTSFQVAAATIPETASDSNPATPAKGSPPVPSMMGPPGEGQGPKKKGVKKSAAAAGGDSATKIRGKPGPKKRQTMDDGTLEPRPVAHRPGPKANQGAINERLRALDRSGKACRKWNKASFRITSFTGSEWEISRWTAPPKPQPINVIPSAGVSATDTVPADVSSGKEIKGNATQPVKSDSHRTKSNAGNVEMQSIPSVQASSSTSMPDAAGAETARADHDDARPVPAFKNGEPEGISCP